MGDFLSKDEGTFTANSLNDMFSAGNIGATFAKVEELRKTFPHLLNPANNPGPRAARKQTVRFAAFLLTDDLLFSGIYPAPKFRAWLKWLTWVGTQTGGQLRLNGTNFNGTASQLILQVLAQALPPGGRPASGGVVFNWTSDPTGNQFGITATTTPQFSIDVTAVNVSHVNANSDDEDDI
ncbi:hypothetical protein JQ615_01175 [Bradyrhizobium jicamae]|uniref:Uncharacterized protein n=1 Tax=Bradyrhizobium jicamae TaxID=280332 RepID=A0ABS5FB29_9BRAD|nr:hypothetical protein [Bradyrhizobium jicamae]MBR0793993.1 hypothetical protein [Bradyrhizobium jicamae]